MKNLHNEVKSTVAKIKNLQPEELQEDIKNDSITRIKTANKEFIQPV